MTKYIPSGVQVSIDSGPLQPVVNAVRRICPYFCILAIVLLTGTRALTHAPSSAIFAASYVFTDLGLPKGSVAIGAYLGGADINNNGLIVGAWAWPGRFGAPGPWPDNSIHGFRWNYGVLTEVSIPAAILDQEPFLTGCRPDNPPSQTASCRVVDVLPRAIDDIGRIAGIFTVRRTLCEAGVCGDGGGWNRGFLMPDGGAATMIGCPSGGCLGGLANVWGLNIAGVVSGDYTTGDGVTTVYQTHGFRGATSLDYPGATSTQARGLNGAFDMDVVGFYRPNQMSSVLRGFLFHLGSFLPIDVPESSLTMPAAINDARDIVGTYGDGGGWHGFAWPNAPLGTAVKITDGTVEMQQPLGNNDSDEIVGIVVTATGQRFVLATERTATGAAVTTGIATDITTTSATLNGTANPNGTATTANFEYGLTSSYGSTTPAQTLGSGNAAVAIGGGALASLSCNTLYHFRARATNTGGTTAGSDATFTTDACVPPAITTQPTNQTVVAGGTATFTAAAGGNPAPTVQWQVRTNGGSTFSDISGATSTTYAFTTVAGDTGKQFRAVFTNGIGSPATSTAATLTVNTSLPTMTASPTTLQFGAINTGGGTLGSKTGSQQVTLTQTGTGTVGWTATANQPWLQVTSGSGTGTGRFTVSVVSAAGLPATGTVTGTLTVAAPAALSNPTVTITLTLSAPNTTSAPFGQVDTPLQSATGVVGAIGVTGWALDDVGVASVRIYRNCLGFDNSDSCQEILGQSVVFVGEAAFLAGARPDVEVAFPSFPNTHAAGWGMQILTNMLPHLPNGQLYGGQGALTVYVIATDLEGRVKVLGRSSDPASSEFAVPTFLTMGNDTIAKPFGTIDTPALGATVSGTIANFGWVLTPDSNTVADAGDILMALSGAGIVVYIDGIPTATVAYNQCRGTVGTPVPGGAFCNDDIASIFGQPTPRALFTPRSSNPTRYRNLDAGRAAIGAYVLDTTTLSNGLHTIAWGVKDSATREEGIGSRFFTVLNSGADAVASDQPAQVRALASAIEGLPASAGPVWGRTGFGLTTPWQVIVPDAEGQRYVRMPEMGRAELWFEAGVEAGYLVVNGTLRDLPVGSTLLERRFAWAPGPGYLGTYTLAFLRDGERTDVQVTIAPARVAVPGESAVRMHLDRATQVSGRQVTVEGWALDPDAPIGSGVGAVHVWARKRATCGVRGAACAEIASEFIFLGTADLGIARPDVAAAHGAPFSHAGFRLMATVPEGEWEVTAYVWVERTGRFEDARSATVIVR